MYSNKAQDTLDKMMSIANPSNFSRREVINLTFGLRDVMFPGMSNDETWEVCDNLIERFF